MKNVFDPSFSIRACSHRERVKPIGSPGSHFSHDKVETIRHSWGYLPQMTVAEEHYDGRHDHQGKQNCKEVAKTLPVSALLAANSAVCKSLECIELRKGESSSDIHLEDTHLPSSFGKRFLMRLDTVAAMSILISRKDWIWVICY